MTEKLYVADNSKDAFIHFIVRGNRVLECIAKNRKNTRVLRRRPCLTYAQAVRFFGEDKRHAQNKMMKALCPLQSIRC